MYNLPQELDAIRAELKRDGIEYAVCGGIAMAVHGFTRAASPFLWFPGKVLLP